MVAGAIAVGAGVQGLAALANYYQAEKARKAGEKRLAEIEAAFEALKPPDYDVSVIDPPELIMESIPEPAFDFSKLKPQEYKLLENFIPEIAPQIAEQAPQIVRDTEVGLEGREAQTEALQRLRDIASGEPDPALQARLDEAAQRSQIESQSAREASLQDMARRGTLGAGGELAASLQGGSEAMSRGADASRDAAVAAYENQLRALRDSASLGGDIRGDELALEQSNTNIINDYNQRFSAAQQDYLYQAANQRNQAQMRNIEGRQTAADQNVSEQNRFAVQERNRQDALQRDLHDRRRGERAYQNQVRQADYANRRGEQDRQNQIKSQQYDDRYRKTSGAAGQAMEGINFQQQGARDRIAAVQGLADAFTTGAGTYADYSNRQEGAQRQDQRAFYKKQGRKPREGEFGYIED